MANYNTLKNAIQEVIKTNGNNEITGQVLQDSLIAMINSLGAQYQFVGVATPSTTPGTPDQNVFYIGGAGTYSNFGTAIVVPQGSLCVFAYNGEWVKNTILIVNVINDLITGGANNAFSAEQGKVLKQELDQLDQKVDEGKLYIEIIKSANIHNSAPATVSDTQPTDGSDWSGHYAQTWNGLVVSLSNCNATYFIEIEDDVQYKSNVLLRSIVFYDEDKTFISGQPRLEEVPAGTAISAPSNAKYAIFTYDKSAGAPSAIKFGKYTDDINVDYSITYIDRDFYGQKLLTENSPLNGGKIQDASITNDKIQNDTITNSKIQDATITDNKMKHPLPTVLSNNLFDKSKMIANGYYINNSGGIGIAAGWACTTLIEIEPSTDYYFYAKSWGRTTGYVWYDENGTSINPTSTAEQTIAGIHTSPSNAKYVRFNLKSNNVDSVNVMLAKSSVEIPYVDYGLVYLPTSAIKDFESEVLSLIGGNKLNIVKDGKLLRINCGSDYVDFDLERNSSSYHVANPVCNIYGRRVNGVTDNSNDDIAPMHILNTTLGANHAQPIQAVTITSHGFTNQDVGKYLVKSGNNVKFYIVRIVNSNVVWMLSELVSSSTYLSPLRARLSQNDVLTDENNTYTVASVENAQMYPGLKNHQVTLYADDNSVSDNGTYVCNKVSICERYDIMNPESVLQNLIANVGSSEDPIYDGNSAVRVENTYTFDGSIVMTVLTTIVFLEAVRFNDFMSTQLGRKGSLYYVPNSLPIATGVDLRTPTNITWSGSIPQCNITQDKVKNQDYPINRVLMYGSSNTHGYAIGYLPENGISQKLNKYTSTYFEIRNDNGKVYPHPSDDIKTLLTYQQVGNIYQTLMYVAPFVPEPSGSKRLSVYTVKNNGITYVYVDYIDSVLDKVIIDSSLNGKKITVLESSNAELISMDNNTDDEVSNNTYNNGFYINANYVSGETCYMVLKID